MQTIEEYRAYTKQLEGEVSKWHHAYDNLMIERNLLATQMLDLKSKLHRANSIIAAIQKQDSATEIDTLASGSRNLNEVINAMSAELEELRKHELAWDLDKARIKELESEINQLKGNFSEAVKLNGELQKTA